MSIQSDCNYMLLLKLLINEVVYLKEKINICNTSYNGGYKNVKMVSIVVWLVGLYFIFSCKM